MKNKYDLPTAIEHDAALWCDLAAAAAAGELTAAEASRMYDQAKQAKTA